MKLRVSSWCAAAAALASLLSACGGGEQFEPFHPVRIIAFGDEVSVIDDSTSAAPDTGAAPLAGQQAGNGRKYTVNALTLTDGNITADSKLDCASNLIWIQYLSSIYGLTFPQCNPKSVTATNVIMAKKGAHVAAAYVSPPVPGFGMSVTAQIDQFMATDAFSGKDLVTVLAGAHDVVDQYALVRQGQISEDQAVATMEAIGTQLAQQVNRIANAGGKVVVTTIPDVGTTPYAVAEEVAHAGSAALLSRLTSRFNVKMRTGLINDGRRIGLMLADESFSSIVKYGGTTYASVLLPVCSVSPVESCTTATLVANGTSMNYLWADKLLPSPAGHQTLGSLVSSRAQGNPF